MSDLALSPARAPALSPAGNPLERLRGLTRQPAVAKSLPALLIAAVLGLAALAYFTLVQPPQRTLGNLADADKAAVADSLGSAGIAYDIDRTTGALSVSDSDYYRAKMLLAQAGLPKSAPDGDQMISALPMGASRAVEGERLRAARESDLARTIEAIDAVEQAKIHLALEQPSVFLRDQKPAAASVMLRLRAGRQLGDGQVQAIVNLVASSVPGLSPDRVSVVDQSGRLLSRPGGDGGPAAAATAQVAIQSDVEDRYRDALTKLLTPLVGADGFTAEVHADMDFAEVQATRESFPNKPGAITQEQGGWSNDATRAAEPGGIPGAIANTPPPPAAATATPPADAAAAPPAPAATTAQGEAGKTSETYNRQFQLDREVSVTRNPAGTVRRLSVAVALKEGAKPRGIAETRALEQLIKGAVGFDERRGDQIAVTSRTFAAEAPEEPAKWYEAGWVAAAARQGSAVLVALVLVFGLARPMMKRMQAGRAAAAAAAPPAPRKAALGQEIAAAVAEDARTTDRQITLDMIESTPGYSDRAALIRNFVRQDPARAALVVRDLIRSDIPTGEKRNG